MASRAQIAAARRNIKKARAARHGGRHMRHETKRASRAKRVDHR